MSEFKLHTIDSSPEASKALLKESVDSFGMLPNLHAVMAESPNILEGYKTLDKLFQTSSFNAAEQTVIWQTINVEHGCHYCVPAHTAIAKMMHVDDAITDALRNETPLPDHKLEALRSFTLQILRNRAIVSESTMDDFYSAGYTQKHVLDVILAIAQKTMSNYVNHLTNTPIDEPFLPFKWEKNTV